MHTAFFSFFFLNCFSYSLFFKDVIPIQSANDWEAAFGFEKGSEAQSMPPPLPLLPDVNPDNDNDFGFDPWVECSKGLADLMEKESSSYTRRPFDNHKTGPPDHLHSQFSFPTNHLHTRPDHHSTIGNVSRVLLFRINYSLILLSY